MLQLLHGAYEKFNQQYNLKGITIISIVHEKIQPTPFQSCIRPVC